MTNLKILASICIIGASVSVFAGPVFSQSATPMQAPPAATSAPSPSAPIPAAPPAVSADTASMPSENPAGATPLRGDETYKEFGGEANIDPMIADFVHRLATDPRISVYFASANLKRLTFELQAQVCYLTGGPCEYSGKDMKSAHAEMGLHDSDFNALAEDLQISMNQFNVPFSAQNKLLAKLAPMERPIVTK